MTENLSDDISCISIIFPDQTVRLTPIDGSNDDVTAAQDQNLPSTFTFSDYTVYLFIPRVDSDNKTCMMQFINSAIRSHTFLRKVSSNNLSEIALVVIRQTDNTLVRGVACYCPGPESCEILPTLRSMAKQSGYKDYKQISMKNHKFSCITYCTDSSKIIKEESFHIKRNEADSPIFDNLEICPVFHDYQRARMILEKCKDQEEVQELLKIYDGLVPEPLDVEMMRAGMKHPFVVVEGLDATGKTTLTETLEKKLNAARYYTPPHHIQHLRKFFDSLPELVRRAYYCLGNYIVAMEISRECQERPVIMDRFWHSTAAYGIANESSKTDLPSVNHSVYRWPSDLLKPTLTLFLSVSEEIRKKRIHNRAEEETFEEKILDKDQLFRQRLCEAYRRMNNPSAVEIDASGTKESVVQEAISALRKYDINLDKKL